VRPEPFVDQLVAPLADEVEIDIAEATHRRPSSMRTNPAAGIPTQSMRCSSS
jgi:hypothetical protein